MSGGHPADEPHAHSGHGGHEGHAEPGAPTTRVWALAGSEQIARSGDAVARALREELGVADVGRLQVAVHPSNGWIDVVDRQQLWARTVAPTLPPAALAEQCARKFLLGLSRRLAARRDDDAPLVLIPPLPSRPLELLAVPAPDGRRWDHWLYRTQPRLASDTRGGTHLPVFGAELEVRIGHGGQVVGFHSRWRPLTGEHRAVAHTPWTPPAPEAGHPHAPGGKAPTPRRVYVLEGADIPQYYLAPYHLVSEGHHLRLASASPLSLTVELGLDEDEDEERTTVSARVHGGSGDYAFRWARCGLEDPLASEREDLGEGWQRRLEDEQTLSEVRIPKGAALMMLNVVDRETGAFKHFQQHVFSSPFPHRGAPPFVLPDEPRPLLSVGELEPPEPQLA